MGQEFRALAHQVHASAHQVAGSAHLAGVDVGLREHATAHKHGDLVGIDAVILGLAAVDGAHVEGVAEDEGDALLSAEICDPVPGEHALDADDQVLPVGGDERQQGVGIGLDVLVGEYGTVMMQDADIQATGVQIDPAVMLVCLGVEFHRGLLLYCRAQDTSRMVGHASQTLNRGRGPQ